MRIEIVEFVKKRAMGFCALTLWITFIVFARAIEWLGVYVHAIQLTLLSFSAIGLFLAPDFKNKNWREVIIITVPILLLIPPILTVVNAPLSDKLTVEDGLVEWASAILLFVGFMIMARLSFNLYKKYKFQTITIFALICTVAFFIMGMEEVSWMQRIFEIKTPAALAEVNMQKELNFHNLQSYLFNAIYVTGGFVLLTLLPFWYKFMQSILNKMRHLKQLEVFMPSAWFIIPFAAIAGYMTPLTEIAGRVKISLRGFGDMGYWPIYLMIFIFTFIILINYLWSQKIKNANMAVLIGGVISLISLVVAGVVFSLLPNQDIRPNLALEYREFFIALGIAVYSVDVLQRYNQNTRRKKRIISKA